jgi:hypothetical protein
MASASRGLSPTELDSRDGKAALRRDVTFGSKGEILAESRCFPLFSRYRTFGASARQGMLKLYFSIRTIPACATVDAIGRVDPSVSASSAPSARRTNRSTIAVGRIRSPSPVSVTS